MDKGSDYRQKRMINMSNLKDENRITRTAEENLRFVNKLGGMIEKLDLVGAKLEQCAFDSINTTDAVLNKMKIAMELMDKLIDVQNIVFDTVEFYQTYNDTEEVHYIVGMIEEQLASLKYLQEEFHEIAQAGVEANDAARSIEHVIVEQTENVEELLHLGEELM